MTNRSLVVGCIATLSLVAVVAAQTGAQQSPQPHRRRPQRPRPGARAQTATPQQAQAQLVTTAEQEKQMLTQYCVACHGERAKASGMDSARKLTLDAMDPGDVMKDGRSGSSSCGSCARG
jgi:mono/diheme cytochrome c family protein